MIDTIVLTLNSSMYQITKPEKFAPCATIVMHPGAWASKIQCKQNPSYKERARERYKPRLTLSAILNSSKNPDVLLRIELSLPKLFFGNNMQELQYKDFRTCAEKLLAILYEMGVVVDYDALVRAPVSAIHYAKNIPLTTGHTPHYFINKIKQSNVSLSLDTNQIQYKNDGHSYRWHCKSYEVIFYDKIRDFNKNLKKIRRRSTSYAGLATQKAQPPTSHLRKFEVLRMEVRLNKRQKIKQLFNALNIKSNYTFQKLFKPAISKKILLHYIDELERMRPAWLDHKTDNDKQLLALLILNNPTMSAGKIARMFGLKKMLEQMTMRELRTMFGNRKGWAALMKEAKEVQLPTEERPLQMVREHIEKFRPVKKFI